MVFSTLYLILSTQPFCWYEMRRPNAQNRDIRQSNPEASSPVAALTTQINTGIIPDIQCACFPLEISIASNNGRLKDDVKKVGK